MYDKASEIMAVNKCSRIAALELMTGKDVLGIADLRARIDGMDSTLRLVRAAVEDLSRASVPSPAETRKCANCENKLAGEHETSLCADCFKHLWGKKDEGPAQRERIEVVVVNEPEAMAKPARKTRIDKKVPGETDTDRKKRLALEYLPNWVKGAQANLPDPARRDPAAILNYIHRVFKTGDGGSLARWVTLEMVKEFIKKNPA